MTETFMPAEPFTEERELQRGRKLLTQIKEPPKAIRLQRAAKAPQGQHAHVALIDNKEAFTGSLKEEDSANKLPALLWQRDARKGNHAQHHVQSFKRYRAGC